VNPKLPSWLPLVVAAIGLGVGGSAFAAADPECPPLEDELAESEYLRALSLDLRGVPPTDAEYEAIASGAVAQDFIAEWMDTPDFAERVVRHHRALLWPNVSDIRLLSNRQRLITDGGIYYRYLVAPNYRGGPVSCGDFEASYDEDGEIVTYEQEDGTIREGWVWVEPYWAPGTEVKVCAFEAQEAHISPLGTECDTYDSRYDPYCGCGPNLAWCDTPTLGHVQEYGVQAPVHAALAGDVEHRIAHVIQNDLSYLEILTGRTGFVNGPLAHFYRYQLHAPAHVRFNEVPVDPEILPDLAYTDVDTWVPVDLGEEQSGILTSPMFLMKFQTRRARANRFYTAFLCQPFQPPDGGVELVDDPNPTADLTQRTGCQYCHALLEPAGAHWGRWSEYGAGYLSPDEGFPTYNPECAWCAETGAPCSIECRTYYQVDPISSEEEPYVGTLLSYQFLKGRYTHHVEEGPKALVAKTVADGRLQQCVAKTTAEWLLGRELVTEEQPWVEALAARFVRTDFDYKELVEDIVTSEPYRRAR